LQLEAIVNAANEPLIMGGGVDGAIRRKAGPEMEAELRRIGRCATGKAVLTRGHRLPAKFVIHTVAPVWHEEAATREEKLRLLGDCYRNALTVAQANGMSEIAFPCLGTGIYGWPADLAARTAFDAVVAFLRNDEVLSRIVFCCFSAADMNRYAALIAALK
ncbi:MAG TPA: macro domain-containing protein, partial [Rhizomicrobium sp.]|nr:macro domain-containing protein [Rhizomicrobium sp.]